MSYSPGLADVKEITFTPTNVTIPSGREIASIFRRDDIDKRYIFRHNNLFFVQNGTPQEVTGDMPNIANHTGAHFDFSDFIKVTTAQDTTTYATYIHIHGSWVPFNYVADPSNLYALQENKIKKVISHLRVAAINPLDGLSNIDGYIDKRGNLFVLTDDNTLYVVRDSKIIAKANVGKLGANSPAIPTMFSDDSNTYFLIPKLTDDNLNSMTGFGSVAEKEIKAKYKIYF